VVEESYRWAVAGPPEPEDGADDWELPPDPPAEPDRPERPPARNRRPPPRGRGGPRRPTGRLRPRR
jgi:hypothetical protein